MPNQPVIGSTPISSISPHRFFIEPDRELNSASDDVKILAWRVGAPLKIEVKGLEHVRVPSKLKIFKKNPDIIFQHPKVLQFHP